MADQEPLVFDLEPIEKPVRVGDVNYVLREATGSIAIKYQNAIINCTKPGIDGKPTQITSGMTNIAPMVVSLCLLDSDGKNVPEATIKSWPAKIQRELFKIVKDMSNLDEGADDEDEIKNE